MPDSISLSQDNNYYIINGEPYVRMTRAIAVARPLPWVDAWKKRVGEEEAARIAAETARDGELIHLVTELYNNGICARNIHF